MTVYTNGNPVTQKYNAALELLMWKSKRYEARAPAVSRKLDWTQDTMIFIHVNEKQCGHGVVSSTSPALPTWGHPPGDGTGRMSPAENEGLDKTLTGVWEAKPAVSLWGKYWTRGSCRKRLPWSSQEVDRVFRETSVISAKGKHFISWSTTKRTGGLYTEPSRTQRSETLLRTGKHQRVTL